MMHLNSALCNINTKENYFSNATDVYSAEQRRHVENKWTGETTSSMWHCSTNSSLQNFELNFIRYDKGLEQYWNQMCTLIHMRNTGFDKLAKIKTQLCLHEFIVCRLVIT